MDFFFEKKKKKKNDITLEKSNFLFLLCFKIAIFKFVPMRQPSGHNFFTERFASNLMLPPYLLGMFLVVNTVCINL